MNGIDLGGLIALAAALAAAGAVTGVLAGLFGVGGGAITVPILFEVFGLLGVPDDVRTPLAVGTSLAIIVPTSLRSARGHYRKGVMDTALLRVWAVPIVLGVLIGSVAARFAEPWVFQIVFVAVAGTNAVVLLRGQGGWRIAQAMPTGPVLRVYGLFIGILSTLMGIGGGALSNLLLTLHNRPIHQAIATSAGVGVLISIPGALGYVWAGWGRAGLPADALGFVSLLGVATVVPTALLTAQVGVNLAHSLPKRRLELLFGLFLVVVGARFVAALLGIF